MWNIDPAIMIPEKIPKKPVIDFPFNAVYGMNDFGNIGYNGPCPDKGEDHRYTIKVYGMDALIDLQPGAGMGELTAALKGHVRAYGETFDRYGR